MIHKEFKLKVAKDILEVGTGYSVSAVHYKVGDTVSLDADGFYQLMDDKAVCRRTNDGYVNMFKENFENEVQVTIITVEHSVRKLGIRK
jgi:hypothetical protein